MMAAGSTKNNLKKLIAISAVISYHAYCYEKTITSFDAPSWLDSLPLRCKPERKPTNRSHHRRRHQCMDSAFYGAIDMGANVYQNRGGDQTFTQDNPNRIGFGDTLDVSPKNDVGFFGGIKLGYVFGTGVVRPTIEGDFFYNGFDGGANFTLRDIDNVVLAQRNATTWINTGAFMANFILRFAPGNQKFQPYVGAGVGIYYAESAGVDGQ